MYIRQYASEMFTFIRYIGLLVGDFIPPEEPVWNIYSTMRRIIDVLLSTSLEVYNCFLLQTLGGEMNELYLNYNKNQKFHFFTYYNSSIKTFGPVIHLWSMHYEAMHSLKNFG